MGSKAYPSARDRLLPTASGLALLLLFVAAPRATASKLKTYRDPVHKFALKVFAEWEQVPTEVGVDWEVAKFYERHERGDVLAPELRVVRIEKEPHGSETGSGGSAPRMGPRGPMPRSVWDATMMMLRPAYDGTRANRKKLKPKKVTSADKVQGQLWIYEAPLAPGDPDRTIWAGLATFEKDGVEYGVYLVCSKRRGEKLLRDFKRIVKSFRFHDEHARDVRDIDILADVAISPKRRAEIEQGMIKGWGIRISPKKNYIVIYNTKGKKNDLLAKIIAERIERLREQVYEKQFPPAHPITAVSIVRICGSRKEYLAYGGPPGSAGYWNAGSEELVFYDASPSKKVDDDTLSVLYHEAFHQYIYYSVGEVAPHSWFNEGHGDYYAGAQYVRGRFKIEPFRWRVGVVKKAIREGPRPFEWVKDKRTGRDVKKWGNKGYTPLEDLVRFSQAEYYAYPSVSYAQGWSLIYFLRETVPKKKSWNAKWGHILDTYFDTLKAEVNPKPPERTGGGNAGEGGEPAPPSGPEGPSGEDGGEPKIAPPQASPRASADARRKAVEKAFEGVDFEELEKAWIESTLKISG